MKRKHSQWLGNPRLLLLQVAGALLWIGSLGLLIAADRPLFGMRGWRLMQLVEMGLVYKVAAVSFLALPASYLAALRSYRLAAALAVIGVCGAALAISTCFPGASSLGTSFVLGPLLWLASCVAATTVWIAAAILDRTDESFHRASAMSDGAPEK